MAVEMKPTYEELVQELARKDAVIARQAQELEQERAALAQERAALAQERAIREIAHKIVRNKREVPAHRIIDLELFYSNPDAILHGQEIALNVAYTRAVIDIGHTAMAEYFAAKSDAGGCEYRCDPVQSENESGKKVYRNESYFRPIPENFTISDNKASTAVLKQREAGKKRAEKRLEKLKQSLLVCPSCGDSEHMHIGLMPVCGVCGHVVPFDDSDPSRVVKAEDVRILVSDEDAPLLQDDTPSPGEGNATSPAGPNLATDPNNDTDPKTSNAPGPRLLNHVETFYRRFCSRPDFYLKIRDDGRIGIGVPEDMSDEEFEQIDTFVNQHDQELRVLIEKET
ncbi:MAG TPA: hypothetical protein VH593_05755 [Ktedonobacteraceae bacterium]|jgi:hypothetical protein